MCLAIYKPADKAISEAMLKKGWLANSGGAGFCYVRKGKVQIVRGLMAWKEFLAAYEEHYKKNKKSPFLIHFRIPSMGDRSANNTHPFPTEHGALIHNGTIYGTGAAHGTGPSDTALLAEKFGSRLTFEKVEAHKKELDAALSHNKVVLLYHDGRHQILNESAGWWHEGVWYSNEHFIPYAERLNMR